MSPVLAPELNRATASKPGAPLGQRGAADLARFVTDHPVRFYVVIALLLGLTLTFMTPKFEANDEHAHFGRIAQIAITGRLVSEKIANDTGGYLPASIVKWIISPNTRTLNNPEAGGSSTADLTPMFYGFSNGAVSSPFSYLPQALGMKLAQFFTDDLMTQLYSARATNLLICTIIIALAIHLTPVLRWFFMLLALMPMTLFMMSSLSPDGLTNACSFLFMSLILRAWASGTHTHTQSATHGMSSRDIVIITLSAAGVGLCKQTCLPLLMAWWLIPLPPRSDRRRHVLGFLALLAAALLVTLIWSALLRSSYTPVRPVVDPAGQLRFLLNNPLQIPTILLNTLAWSTEHARQFVGVLGQLSVPMPGYAIGLHLLALFLVSVFDPHFQGSRWRLTTGRRLASAWLWVAGVLFVVLMIYLTWMGVGDDYVHIQGRYFIPLAPLLGIAFAGLVPLNERSTDRFRIFAGPLCLLHIVCMIVFAIVLLQNHYAPLV